MGDETREEGEMIEKLEHRWADGFSACGGASLDDVIDKINEIIDVLNGLVPEASQTAGGV